MILGVYTVQLVKPHMKNFLQWFLIIEGSNLYCLKDGASFCYCAYVLSISGYLGLYWNLPTNTTMFLRGLWLGGKSRS